MKKTKVTYRNRSNDEIEFNLTSPHTVEMTGFFELGLRYGWNDDGAINMVDPNGGPYLTEDDDIGKLLGLDTKKKIHCFTIDPSKITIHLK